MDSVWRISRDILNATLYFEYYQEKLFLHNNLAKSFVRGIQSAMHTHLTPPRGTHTS